MSGVSSVYLVFPAAVGAAVLLVKVVYAGDIFAPARILCAYGYAVCAANSLQQGVNRFALFCFNRVISDYVSVGGDIFFLALGQLVHIAQQYGTLYRKGAGVGLCRA